ncbi:hypothetical protein INT45_007660 [Circinella minor]|uniref:F-box domain-containing protein n=1 Tax=Circinella minor TaxID=1195481 RepID=A0A8H7S050_9FUNG|nr:hypothetical protein INT45_007660 [Circinella minor]
MNDEQQYNPSPYIINDPLYSLPFDVITNIVILLPQDVRVECLKVSRLWREHILACAEAWFIVSLENGEDDNPMAELAYDISKHVKHLKMTTTSEHVCSQYLKQLRAGHFTRIQSLKIAEEPSINGLEVYNDYNATNRAHHNVVEKTLQTLQIENTLTYLDINVGFTCNPEISIAEVIATFPYLTDLIFSSESRFYPQVEYFYDIMTTPHQYMINLELRASIILETDIKCIATFCPKLRRLVLNGCVNKVLHAIVECQNTTMKNLEIFAFNPDNIHPPIPTLSTLSTKTQTMVNDNGIDESNEEKGLRILYTNNGCTPVPTEDILPLIYQNRETLETIYACISRLTDIELEYLYNKYVNFELKKIKYLTIWLAKGIQQWMLGAIKNSTSLVWLELVDIWDVNALMDTLIKMPPLYHIKLVAASMKPSDHKKLIQLLERYAQIANDGKTDSLRSIAIQFCDNVITDDILGTLGNIKTLEEVWLGGLTHTTSVVEIHTFIAKLGKQQLKGIYFDRISVITDTTIATVLGDMVDTLSYIKLKELEYISDNGIRALIDKKTNDKNGLSLLLEL